jgi:hypothetical protein
MRSLPVLLSSSRLIGTTIEILLERLCARTWRGTTRQQVVSQPCHGLRQARGEARHPIAFAWSRAVDL